MVQGVQQSHHMLLIPAVELRLPRASEPNLTLPGSLRSTLSRQPFPTNVDATLNAALSEQERARENKVSLHATLPTGGTRKNSANGPKGYCGCRAIQLFPTLNAAYEIRCAACLAGTRRPVGMGGYGASPHETSTAAPSKRPWRKSSRAVFV
jgi:hypothetical protein